MASFDFHVADAASKRLLCLMKNMSVKHVTASLIVARY